MSEKTMYDSLLETAEGAIMERVDEEAKKVWLNLQDPNTDFKAKRKITLELIFEAADENRDLIHMTAKATCKLAPMVPVPVSLPDGYVKEKPEDYSGQGEESRNVRSIQWK